MEFRAVVAQEVVDIGCEAVFAVVARHDSHPWQGCGFLSLELSIAAGDNNMGLGPALGIAPYGLAAFAVGCFGDGASVDHHQIGCLAPWAACYSALFEELLD